MMPSDSAGTGRLTLARMVAESAARFGDALAVAETTGLRLSFNDVASAARGAAAAFIAAGVLPGDRIAIWAPNSAAWVIAAVGLQMAGAILVPLNTRFKAAEAIGILRRIRPVTILTTANFLQTDYAAMLAAQLGAGTASQPLMGLPSVRALVLLDDAARPNCVGWSDFRRHRVDDVELDTRLATIRPEDTGDILFTSGTTGIPKGAQHSQGQNLWMVDLWNRNNDLRPGDRQLVVNPFFHSFGYRCGFVSGLMAGMTTWPMPMFDALAAMELVARQRITVLMGSPTLFLSILDHPERSRFDLSSLRVAHTGAAKSPVQLIGRLRDELGFDLVLTSYGLTEATALVSGNLPGASFDAIATTVGPPVTGVDIRIDAAPGSDSGEVLTRGPNVMQGYFEDAAATAAAIDPEGWLHTGDVGTIDADGNLRILDRIKDVVIVGGFNAYPAEIENVLTEHPAIAEAAIVAVADARQGEVCGAVVVLRPDHSFTLAELAAWCRERMANYKVPRHLLVLDALPKTALGKPQKFLLRERMQQNAHSEAEMSEQSL